MASGFTASHPTLPFNSMIRVTNPSNGRSIDVRVNDGDSGRDNITLTLSKKAAKKLKMKKGLTHELVMEVIK